MKKIKYILAILALPLVAISCSDLEEDAPGRLNPETFFNSPRDIQTAVNGAIGNMATEEYWGRKLTLPIMLRSDMVTIGDKSTAARRRDIDTFTVTASNGMITAFWPKSFEIIASTNNAITGASKVDASADVVNPIVGQALFIRAFAYYHLVRLFGGVPYITESITPDIDPSAIQKNTEAEVYLQIIEDLQIAKRDLPDTQSSRAIPSKATASGYLASVYLTVANLIENGTLTGLGTAQEYYERARDEAVEIIDNAGDYELALESDYQNLFNSSTINSSLEPLFTIDFNGLRDGNFGRDFHAALTGIRDAVRGSNGEGWSVAVPSPAVFNTWDNRDYRKIVSFDFEANFINPETKELETKSFSEFRFFDKRNFNSGYIAKYSRFPGNTNEGNGRASSHNYITMRYAEILLIAAEAINELDGGSSTAINYVNQVLERARNGNSNFPENISGLSQDELRDKILEERRLELAFEFKRWYDIKRKEIGSEVFSESGLEPQPNFNPDRDYYLPIPNDELVRVPGLGPQNQGY